MYAVVETGAKQYKVTAGDTLQVERLDAEQGKSVTLDKVLLVNNDGQVTVGTPTVSNASVVADVVKHIRGEKVISFKMKKPKKTKAQIASIVFYAVSIIFWIVNGIVK